RETPRPSAPTGPWPCRRAASTSSPSTAGYRPRMRAEAGAKWVDLGLVFTTRYGTPLDSADVRRDFRAAIGRAAGVDARQWTPRELRHSFVSLLSDSGVPIEEISRLVGHRSTVVT